MSFRKLPKAQLKHTVEWIGANLPYLVAQQPTVAQIRERLNVAFPLWTYSDGHVATAIAASEEEYGAWKARRPRHVPVTPTPPAASPGTLFDTVVEVTPAVAQQVVASIPVMSDSDEDRWETLPAAAAVIVLQQLLDVLTRLADSLQHLQFPRQEVPHVAP